MQYTCAVQGYTNPRSPLRANAHAQRHATASEAPLLRVRCSVSVGPHAAKNHFSSHTEDSVLCPLILKPILPGPIGLANPGRDIHIVYLVKQPAYSLELSSATGQQRGPRVNGLLFTV